MAAETGSNGGGTQEGNVAVLGVGQTWCGGLLAS